MKDMESMKTGQGLEDIDRLINDFIGVHKNDYLALQPYIQYLRAAYALGVCAGQVRKTRPVVRSDGQKYKSIIAASRINKINESSIRKAIKKEGKSAGYYWKYA